MAYIRNFLLTIAAPTPSRDRDLFRRHPRDLHYHSGPEPTANLRIRIRPCWSMRGTCSTLDHDRQTLYMRMMESMTAYQTTLIGVQAHMWIVTIFSSPHTTTTTTTKRVMTIMPPTPQAHMWVVTIISTTPARPARAHLLSLNLNFVTCT